MVSGPLLLPLGRLLSVLLPLLHQLQPSAAAGGVKVFVLAGQSNMEGKGKGSDFNPPPGNPPQDYHQGLPPGALLNGTLLYQVHDPRTAKDFAQYWDKDTGNWTVLSDVKVWFNEWGSQTPGKVDPKFGPEVRACIMPGDCDGSPSPWRKCPNHDSPLVASRQYTICWSPVTHIFISQPNQ